MLVLRNNNLNNKRLYSFQTKDSPKCELCGCHTQITPTFLLLPQCTTSLEHANFYRNKLSIALNGFWLHWAYVKSFCQILISSTWVGRNMIKGKILMAMHQSQYFYQVDRPPVFSCVSQAQSNQQLSEVHVLCIQNICLG